jgi:D-alanyl-D-alanine carboxypeptidase
MNRATYKQRIEKIHRLLGIADSYATEYALPLQTEEQDLIGIGDDIYGRPQLLCSKIATKWYEMRDSAKKEGIDLFVISAFRSVEYQASIVHNKLEKGQKISDILKVSAAPGHSEHHTGCALDLTTAGINTLSDKFEQTKAFSWLQSNAENFGFRLSYPKNTTRRIEYEPWHWACL